LSAVFIETKTPLGEVRHISGKAAQANCRRYLNQGKPVERRGRKASGL